MGIGIRMRRLWRLRAGVLLSVALALFVALWSVEEISVFPPGLRPRSLEMATAVAHVLVDTPTSSLVDLRQDTYSVSALQDRAVVLGNVIANPPVETAIAQEAHIPVAALRIQAPLTPAQASPQVNSQTARHVTDILRSNDQYRLDIEANTTVPLLDIYAQTPSAESAAALANAAVDQLRAYLAEIALHQETPLKDQIRLSQLGRATGTVINPGVSWQVALLAFLLTLGVSCATVTFVARVRAGWRQEALSERAAQA
jgi:hypothetical protein